MGTHKGTRIGNRAIVRIGSRRALLLAAAAAALVLMPSAADEAAAQYRGYKSGSPVTQGPSMRPTGPRRAMPPPRHRGPNWGGIAAGAAIGVIVGSAISGAHEPPPPPPHRAAPPPHRAAPPPRQPRGPQAAINIPPASERRFVPDEAVIELAGTMTPQAIEALAARHRLTVLETHRNTLSNSTIVRVRIADRRPLRTVLRRLGAEGALRAAQPNYVFRLMRDAMRVEEAAAGDPAQYALTKLRLPQAHRLARGEGVLVAVIDSGVDTEHPELAGAIAGTFDAYGSGLRAHSHGTGIAGAIAARARLLGAAPAARILAIQAFDTTKADPHGTTYAIVRALDHAAAAQAKVVNMSFAGPADPSLSRQLAVARSRGMVLIAAVGNAGPRSAPLFPASNRHVIAVTAVDAEARLFQASNRGRHVDVAAPGVDILVPAPERNYQVQSGTSFAAAHVSGIAALMLERRPTLSHDMIRRALMSTATDLGPPGHDTQFGAGLADALRATNTAAPPTLAAPRR